MGLVTSNENKPMCKKNDIISLFEIWYYCIWSLLNWNLEKHVYLGNITEISCTYYKKRNILFVDIYVCRYAYCHVIFHNRVRCTNIKKIVYTRGIYQISLTSCPIWYIKTLITLCYFVAVSFHWLRVSGENNHSWLRFKRTCQCGNITHNLIIDLLVKHQLHYLDKSATDAL